MVNAATESTPRPDLGQVHFIGIGGSGMSSIALLMAHSGMAVNGSDARDSDTVASLRAHGLDVQIGADPSWLAGADTVVITSAVKPTNPMLVAAKEQGLRVMHRSEALAWLTQGHSLIAVAGAHGKSTTSAMITHIMIEAGLDPTAVVGAKLTAEGAIGGGRPGAGEWFVIEADESDRSFLNYAPTIGLVTNIEPDHLAFYGSAEAHAAAFDEFAGLCDVLIACSEDAGSAALAQRRAGLQRVITYGAGGDADLVGNTVRWNDEVYELNVSVLGRHNVLNAAGAWLAAVLAGADPQRAAAALATFTNAGRRFEHKGTVGGVEVFDDYAHHPTEIAALLNAAREYTDGRVLVLFQPHLVSRTKDFAAEFAEVLEAADEVVVPDICVAREEPDPSVSSTLITDRMQRSYYVPDRIDSARYMAGLARSGDTIFTVGCGDVNELGPVILAALREREAAGK